MAGKNNYKNGHLMSLYQTLKDNDMFTRENLSYDQFERDMQGRGYNTQIWKLLRDNGAKVSSHPWEFRKWAGVDEFDNTLWRKNTAKKAQQLVQSANALQQRNVGIGKYIDGQKGKAVINTNVNIGKKKKSNVVVDKTTGKAYTQGGEKFNANDKAEMEDAEHLQELYDKQQQVYNEAVDNGMIADPMDVDAGLSDAEVKRRMMERRKAYAAREMKKRSKEIDTQYAGMPQQFNSHTEPTMQAQGYKSSDQEYQLWKTAKQKNEDTMQMLDQQIREESQKKEDGSSLLAQTGSAISNFGKGIWDAITDYRTWDPGITEMQEANTMLDAKRHMENGNIKEGSDEDVATQVMLTSLRDYDDQQRYQAAYGSKAYSNGAMTGISLTLVPQFLITGGSSTLTKGGAKLLTKMGIKEAEKGFQKYAVKAMGRILSDAARATVLTGALQGGKTYAAIMDDYLGVTNEKGATTYDEKGKLKFNEGKSLGRSIYDAGTQQFVENFSELMGEWLPGGEQMAQGLRHIGLSKVADMFAHIGSNGVYQALSNADRYTGVSGIFGEIMEEEFGIALNSMLNNGGSQWSDLIDGEKQFDLMSGLFFSVGAMNAPRYVAGTYSGAQYMRYRHYTDNADTEAKNVLGGRWDSIRDVIDGTTNDDMTKVVRSYLSQKDQFTSAERNCISKYALNLSRMRGYNTALTANTAQEAEEVKNNPEKQEELLRSQERNASYMAGANATADQRRGIQLEYEQARKQLADNIGVEDIALDQMSEDDILDKLQDDDQLDMADDFLKKKAAYIGMQDAANQMVEDAEEQATAEVDKMTNLKKGIIQSATLKSIDEEEDKDIFIVGGNLVTFSDGSIDLENSDKMIVIYNPETKERETISPARLLKVTEERTAQDVKDEAAETAAQKVQASNENDINGKVATDSVYSIIDETGVTHTIEVGEMNQDGTVNATYDGQPMVSTIDALQQERDISDAAIAKVQSSAEAAQSQTKQKDDESNLQGEEAVADEVKDFVDNIEFDRMIDENGNIVPVDVENPEQGHTYYKVGQTGQGNSARYNIAEFDANMNYVGTHRMTASDVVLNDPMSVDEKKEQLRSTAVSEYLQSINEHQQERLAAANNDANDINDNVEGPQQEQREGDEVATDNVAESKEDTSALSRIPVDEKTQEPLFEQVDSETALQGLNELTGNNTNSVAAIVNAQVQQANKALETLKGKKPKKTTPKLQGSPMEMLKAQQQAEAKYESDMEKYNAQVDAAEQKVNVWNNIASAMLQEQEPKRKEKEAETNEVENADASNEGTTVKLSAKERPAEHQEVNETDTNANTLDNNTDSEVLDKVEEGHEGVADWFMPKAMRKDIEKVAKKLGYNVQWLYTNDKSNGFFVGNTVYLSLDAERPYQFVFGHEMTHAIKSQHPQLYKRLMDAAKAMYADDEEFQKRVEDTTELYRSRMGGYFTTDAEGNKVEDMDAYTEEVVADTMGEAIFNAGLMRDIAFNLDHPTLAAIRDAITSLLQHLTGKNLKNAVDSLSVITDVYNQAYEEHKQGKNSEETEIPESDAAYSIRQKPAPKETKKGYAVFIVKQDRKGKTKLVPKMLSNDPGAPASTWLDAETGKMKRDENGKPLQNADGRAMVSVNGLQSGGTTGNKLAWRPGKHLCAYPNAAQFMKKDGTIPKNVVFFEVEYAADPELHKKYQTEAWELGMKKSGKYDNTRGGLPYIPEDSYYIYRTNQISEGAAPMIITGAYKINRALTDAEAKQLNQENGGTWAPREGGELTEEGLKQMGVDKDGLKRLNDNFDFDSIAEKHDESADAIALPGYVRRNINWEDPELQKAIKENGQEMDEYKNGYSATSEKTDNAQMLEDTTNNSAENLQTGKEVKGLSIAVTEGNSDIKDASGEVVAQTDADHKAKLSLRTYTPWVDNFGRQHEGTRAQVLEYMKKNGFADDQIKNMLDTMDYGYKYFNKLAEFTNPDGTYRFEELHRWNERQPQYKAIGENIENVVSTAIKNGEYAVNQELSTDCIKREAFTKLVNHLIARGADLSAMGPAQINTIKDMMRKYGIQVACDLCFVEGKRLGIVNWAQTFVDDWNKALEAAGFNPDELEDFNFGHYAYDENGNVIGDAAFVPTEEYKNSTQVRAINEAYALLTQRGKEYYDAMKKRNVANWKQWLKDNQVAKKWKANHKGERWSEKHLTNEQKEIKDSFLTFGVDDPKKIYRNSMEYAKRYAEMEKKYQEKHPGKAFTPTKTQLEDLGKIRNREIKDIFKKMQRLIIEFPEMRKKMQLSDLLGSKGLMQIRQENGEGYAQLWSLILGRFGSGTPKPIQDAVPYSGEVFDITDGLISKAYEEGGARMFSFSDFDITKVFDIMQIYWDMAAREMKLQSYSKEAAYIIMFGKTGAKINMSTLPKAVVSEDLQRRYNEAKNDEERSAAQKEGAENAGLITDEDGRIVDLSWSEEHSLKPDFCQSIFRDPERNGNCGAVTVGASVNHSIFAAAQPWIRMVIPFHLSGMPIDARKRTDVNWYFDNTPHQNTRVKLGGNWVSIHSEKAEKAHLQDFNFYENEDSADWDMRQRCRDYLKWCDEKGYTPRFEWGIDSNHYKEWCAGKGYTPNQQIVDIMDNDMTDGVWNGYYKFITDFNAYKPVLDKMGNPVFDENGHLVETVAKHMPVTTNIKLSDAERRAIFGDITGDATEFADMSVLQNRENSINYADANMQKMAAEVQQYLDMTRKHQEGEVTDADIEQAEADMKGEGGTFFNSANDAEILMEAENGIRYSLKQEKENIIAEAKKNGTYLKAPNGEDTNLDSDQWATVRTSNFKNWFGDWEKDPEHASKVVDENGEPKVVYHQTNSTVWINRETGENYEDLDWKEKDYWKNEATQEEFEDAWEEQDFYTFDNTKHGRRSVEMPAFFFAPEYDEYHEYGDRTVAAFLNIKNPAVNPEIENRGVYNDAGEKAMQKLIDEGYDGFIRKYDGKVNEINAFYPNQVKSADDYNGDFSTENNDIRYSLKSVNDKFNADLDRYVKGEMKSSEMLHLGNPNRIMRMFLPDLPVVMRTRILNKASNTKHNVEVSELKDLPLRISEPIFVFKRSDNALGVLTEIKDRDGLNVCVAIELNKTIQDGGDFLEVNDIRSIHGRNAANLIEPIVHNNTLVYADKKKGLAWLSSASYNYQQEIDKQDLETAAKIINDFKNPNTIAENLPESTKYSLRETKFKHELAEWKKQNGLPKTAKEPQVPIRDINETDAEWKQRLAEYRKEAALWKTAPTYEADLVVGDDAEATYNRALQRKSIQARIVIQDGMLAIREAQNAISREVGSKIGTQEDAYNAENRSHGKAKNEMEEYNHFYLEPLRKAYNALKNQMGGYGYVKNYLMAKHGLERNAYMAFMAAAEEQTKTEIDDIKKQHAKIDAKIAADKTLSAAEKQQQRADNKQQEKDEIDNVQSARDRLTDYQNDLGRIMNDADYHAGKIDFETYRQRDNSIRIQYAPMYLNHRYDKMGIPRDFAGLSALFGNETKRDFELEAGDYVTETENKHGGYTDDLWDAIHAATNKTLFDSYRAGMMTKKQYQSVRDMFQDYIPLRGWNETTADDVWDYVQGGNGAMSSILQTMRGRESIADDPIAYIEQMAQSAIIINNKNDVKQRLLLLARNHPTSLLTLSKAWYIKTTDAQGNAKWIPASPNIPADVKTAKEVQQYVDQFEKNMELLEKTGDATQKKDGLHIEYPQTAAQEREHEIRVMDRGQEYVIYVNGDPALAQAINGTRSEKVREDSGLIDKATAKVGRFLSQTYTSFSPMFVPSNYFRDLTMVSASTAVREDRHYNALLYKNFLQNWGIHKLVAAYSNGSLKQKIDNGTATKNEEDFYNYMMNGGETGYVTSVTVDEFKSKIMSEFGKMDEHKLNPKKLWRAYAEAVEFLNRGVEASNRYLVYKTSIEYGRSVEEAINDAKNVTLNFNRKGTGEHGVQVIRNLYLFINPAIQSLQTLGALAKDYPGKLSAVAMAWIASGALVPAFNQAMLSAFGDDDDKDKYWRMAKWDRRNNAILYIPFSKEIFGETNFVKIPLAQEFRVFYGLGDMLASIGSDSEMSKQTAKEYASDIMGQVLDLMPLDPTGYGGQPLLALMPDALRWPFALAMNTDFTGKPISKESEYNQYMPTYTKAYKGTPDWLVQTSRTINAIGNDFPDEHQNAIDRTGLINPAKVDYVLKTMLGGSYTFLSKGASVATKMLREGPGAISTADVPLWSSFVINPNNRPQSQKQGDGFWDMADQCARVESEIGTIRKEAEATNDFDKLKRYVHSADYREYLDNKDKVDAYQEQKKIEKLVAKGQGDTYKPHKTTADGIYNKHRTIDDIYEDMKLDILWKKLNAYDTKFNALGGWSKDAGRTFHRDHPEEFTALRMVKIHKDLLSTMKKLMYINGKDKSTEAKMKRVRKQRQILLQELETATKNIKTPE